MFPMSRQYPELSITITNKLRLPVPVFLPLLYTAQCYLALKLAQRQLENSCTKPFAIILPDSTCREISIGFVKSKFVSGSPNWCSPVAGRDPLFDITCGPSITDLQEVMKFVARG